MKCLLVLAAVTTPLSTSIPLFAKNAPSGASADDAFWAAVAWQRDANWADWYAAYMAAEQSGEELPQ
jgi:hypothetical protein